MPTEYIAVARRGGLTWRNGDIPKALIGVYGLRTGNQWPFGQDTVNTDAAFISTEGRGRTWKDLHVKVRPLVASGLGNENRRRLVL